MDGVLVDLPQGCCDKVGVPNPYYDDQGRLVNSSRGFYNMGKLTGISPDVFLGGLTVDDWANLKPMPDAFKILQRVEAFFGLENICLLSNPLGHPSMPPEVMVGKWRWIERNIPLYKDRFLFGPQKEFCVNPQHVMIDDYEINVDSFIASGGTAFLVPRPWNRASHEGTLEALDAYLEGLK